MVHVNVSDLLERLFWSQYNVAIINYSILFYIQNNHNTTKNKLRVQIILIKGHTQSILSTLNLYKFIVIQLILGYAKIVLHVFLQTIILVLMNSLRCAYKSLYHAFFEVCV